MAGSSTSVEGSLRGPWPSAVVPTSDSASTPSVSSERRSVGGRKALDATGTTDAGGTASATALEEVVPSAMSLGAVPPDLTLRFMKEGVKKLLRPPTLVSEPLRPMRFSGSLRTSSSCFRLRLIFAQRYRCAG